MKLITVADVCKIITKIGLRHFFLQLIVELENSFSAWETTHKSARHVMHYPHGVIELMPISTEKYYACKYVNGHPYNPQKDKLTVVAVGLLADVATGYPLLISEMTLLTALRTAATTALAARYLAKKEARSLGIIGTGAQSEFLVLAMEAALTVRDIYYFDLDQHAMQKFSHNLQSYDLRLFPCNNAEQTVNHVDIIITATSAKKKVEVLQNAWVSPGQFIAGIGGDCADKTELDPEILKRSKIVVEFLPQTKEEGEIQQLENQEVYAELWELITGKKPGRVSNEEITVFDSVGFALEDYAALKLIDRLADELQIGSTVELIPQLQDPKNLFSLLQTPL